MYESLDRRLLRVKVVLKLQLLHSMRRLRRLVRFDVRFENVDTVVYLDELRVGKQAESMRLRLLIPNVSIDVDTRRSAHCKSTLVY